MEALASSGSNQDPPAPRGDFNRLAGTERSPGISLWPRAGGGLLARVPDSCCEVRVRHPLGRLLGFNSLYLRQSWARPGPGSQQPLETPARLRNERAAGHKAVPTGRSGGGPAGVGIKASWGTPEQDKCHLTHEERKGGAARCGTARRAEGHTLVGSSDPVTSGLSPRQPGGQQ